jgi:hypothetical protein
MFTSIQGVWGMRTRKNSSDWDILYIYPDGRLVQFMRSRGQSVPVPFKIRVFPDGADKFRIKARADAVGWPAEVQSGGASLVIEAPGSKALWGRVPPAELPEWLETAISSVVWD